MFDDDDPGLAELRRIALEFPGAAEKVSFGRPVFHAPKMFAMYGGTCKTTGETVAFPHSVLVKVDEAERPALEQDDRFFSPMYFGPFGWLGLDLTSAEADWEEITELVDASFRLAAAKKLIRELDARRR